MILWLLGCASGWGVYLKEYDHGDVDTAIVGDTGMTGRMRSAPAVTTPPATTGSVGVFTWKTAVTPPAALQLSCTVSPDASRSSVRCQLVTTPDDE